MVKDAQDVSSSYPLEDALEYQFISLKSTVWLNDIQMKIFVSRFVDGLLFDYGNQLEDIPSIIKLGDSMFLYNAKVKDNDVKT